MRGRYGTWDDGVVDRITHMSPLLKHTTKSRDNMRACSDVRDMDTLPKSSRGYRQADQGDDDDDDLFQQLENTLFRHASSAKKNPCEGIRTPRSVPKAKQMPGSDCGEELYTRLEDAFAQSSPLFRAQGVDSTRRNAVEMIIEAQEKLRGKNSGSESVWSDVGDVTAEFVRDVLSGEVSMHL